MNKTCGSVDHVIRSVRPDDPTDVAQKAMDEYADSMRLRPYVAYVSGYNMAIAIPPDWVGHTFIDSDTGLETAHYDPGMITNYENLYTVLNPDPGWKGGHRRRHRDNPDDRQRPRDALKFGQKRDGYQATRWVGVESRQARHYSLNWGA